MTETIDILLSTYNGERYLDEQIYSIIAQTEVNWRLIARDDGSTDSTVEILHRFARSYPDKIVIICDDEHLGTCQSFSRLMERATARFVMFCDQDDVWLPYKIAISREKMLDLETASGSDTPLLVHTDLRVVDSELKTIADSFWSFQGLDPAGGSRLNKLLTKNVVTGGAIMVNRALQRLALPIPPEAIMHDWWLALVTATFGTFGTISQPTLLYRQHHNNVIGASQTSFYGEITGTIRTDSRRAATEESQRMFRLYITQTQSFLERFRTQFSKRQLELLNAFINLSSYNVFVRKFFIIKHRFFYNNPLITLGMLLFKWK
jgi:glycosyltransferase involved in cell wall biosynthesis